MIRIAQASSSELYRAWGTPPNQRRTGVTKDKPGGNMDGELNVMAFYGGWEKVFRPVESGKGDKIAYLAERTVMNGGYIGYGQNNGQYPRTGLFDALLKQGSNPDPMIIHQLINVDCSSMVGACVYFAGIKSGALRDMWTGTERDVLMKTGQFVELTDKTLLQSGVGIKRGDILWKTGHTAVALDSDSEQETTPAVIWDCAACNLRSGSGVNYKVLKTLHPGDIVQKVSRADNGWWQVKSGAVYGYVSPKYVKDLKTMTATGNVWLRDGAGTKATEIIVIPKGAAVYVTGVTIKNGLTTWYQAFYAGKEGWASGKYLR